MVNRYKQPKSKPNNTWKFLVFVAVVTMFSLVTYYSHIQLGLKEGNRTIFVSNKIISKFSKSVGPLPNLVHDIHLPRRVIELEHSVFNGSWINHTRRDIGRYIHRLGDVVEGHLLPAYPDEVSSVVSEFDFKDHEKIKSIDRNKNNLISHNENQFKENGHVFDKDSKNHHIITNVFSTSKIIPSNQAIAVGKSSLTKLSGKSKLGANNITYNPTLTCPHADLVTYWRVPSEFDKVYRSPFADVGPKEKYVTFEPDVGGWNNIRMQMETVLVFAIATGRILVLPPDQPLYLLNKGKGHENAHNFADFFPFDIIKERVPVITMSEFMAREGLTGHLSVNGSVSYPPGNKTEFEGTNRLERLAMWGYLRDVASCPPWKCMTEFLVIPPGPGINVSTYPDAQEYRKRRDIFAATRTPYYYDNYWQNQRVIHFISLPGSGYRLLAHFYTFIHFEDMAMDRLYKRFVRDYVHYVDDIFCKAAKIIHALLQEGREGSYSAFHIRRGEFQYKEVKIPAENLMHNVGHLLPKNQLIFIASDERNKSFFLPFKHRFPKLRFLDDYMEMADLHTLNPNFLGMIDQLICSRGQYFVGTWFSTFSGYITRMRGYLGYKDSSVYYGDMKHRDRYQFHEDPKFPFYMREWNISWDKIDG